MSWLSNLGILEEIADTYIVGFPKSRPSSPEPPTHIHTQLLSFLLSELFFLILIPVVFKAKITVKGDSES